MREPKSRLRRAGDTQFKWVVPQLGEPFSDLVNLAQEWLARHASGIDLRMHALALFELAPEKRIPC
jgi:hypothetical protein